jgi:hypothetical protein
MKMKFILLLIGIFFSVSGLASSGNGWHNITQVELNDTHHLIIKFANSSHAESCAVASLHSHLIVDKNHPQIDMYYSMALAAVMSGKPVYAWVNGCIDPYNSGSKRARITKLVIK